MSQLKTKSIYDGMKVGVDHPKAYGNAFFGVYQKEPCDPHKFTLSESYAWKSPKSEGRREAPVAYTAGVNQDDLVLLKKGLANHDAKLFASPKIDAVLNSIGAQNEVSVAQIAHTYIEGMQAPKAAGFAAAAGLAALASHQKSASDPLGMDESSERARAATLAFGLKVDPSIKGVFLVSAQEFRSGDFAQNPLSVDEVKALPFLGGLLAPIYKIAGQDLSVHAAPVAQKLFDAGYPNAASEVCKRFELGIELEKTKSPARKHAPDDGFSL